MIADSPFHHAPLLDPRDPPTQIVNNAHFDFRRNLSQCLEVVALAVLVGRLHHKCEGWTFPDHPTPAFLRPFRKAAELAVRYSSPEILAGARSRAADQAERRFDGLMAELRSCDTTRSEQELIMRRFAGELIDVFVRHLAVGCGRHQAEWTAFHQQEEQDAQEAMDTP